MSRQTSYGQKQRLTPVDRFGVWLSMRRIRSTIGTGINKRIADIGCGYHGRIGRLFAEEAEKLVLVDLSLSPELKDDSRITAVEGRLPEALSDLADGSLDIILCNSVLEHLDRPLDTLKAFRRLLAPEGIALINVPSWRGKWFLEFSAFRLGLSPAEEINDHKAYYDPKDLWPLLIEAGFKPSGITCFKHKFGLNTFAVCRTEPEI
ncbi:MAG: class I SAM-dependent methyltransferase [Rhodospirillales bacterium]|nr:class I SAM-dependent methyltransferase [Rhodospirillales bacterium]